MFNDRYGLTEAVLGGRKTQTRRIITCPKEFKGEWVAGFHVYKRLSDGAMLEYPSLYDADESTIDGGYILPKYKIGEVVAVAQSYKDAGVNPQSIIGLPIKGSKTNGILQCEAQYTSSWTNKMFVRADLMPHHIRIANVRVERLQDISDEDCIKEGVREVYVNNNWGNSASHWEFQVSYEDKLGRTKLLRGFTPQEAYAALIDRISGKGTWESNPYVFVYDFELVD